MGQELHITRVDDWTDGLITQEEWLGIIETDPDLVSQAADPLTAFWTAAPDYDRTKPAAEWAPQLYYLNGKIACNLTDQALTEKACQIAAKLDAIVHGDGTEKYNPDGSISNIAIVDEAEQWQVDTRWRWDDPEFWRPPTPEEVNLPIAEFTPEELTRYFQLPGWQRACKRVWYALKRRFAPKA